MTSGPEGPPGPIGAIMCDAAAWRRSTGFATGRGGGVEYRSGMGGGSSAHAEMTKEKSRTASRRALVDFMSHTRQEPALGGRAAIWPFPPPLLQMRELLSKTNEVGQ